MLTMQEIKAHYFFTDEDARLLQELQPLMERQKERMADEFYDYLLGIPETAALLREDVRLNRLKATHMQWFVTLFSGSYDNQYLHTLQRIGHASLSTTQKYTHVSIDRLMEVYDQAHPKARDK